MPRPRHTRWSRIAEVLTARGPLSATVLAREVGVSVPTLHRYLQAHSAAWVATGQGARRRYALRRRVAGVETDAIPVARVDAHGRIHEAGHLHPIAPRGSCYALGALGWPVAAGPTRDWWESLPYPVLDMRPQGYIGRRYARALGDRLGLPPNPSAWSDDDILRVITGHGADLPGDLIVGEGSMAAWHRTQARLEPPLRSSERPGAYTALAEAAAAGELPGSSAGGEFPKFTARREPDSPSADTEHVLVKFSAPDDGGTATRRWRDLLLCEHLALQALATVPGVQAAATRMLDHAGRRFLEVERFDRLGPSGRRPVVTLGAVDLELVGLYSHDWRAEARALARHGWLDAGDQQAVCRQWWFGRLIANTDMHPGNLALRPDGGFRPAPAYDMLPTGYAPLVTGEVRRPDFDPPLPPAGETADWQAAATAAVAFWQSVADTRVLDEGLRSAGAANATAIQRVAERLG